MPRSIVVLVDRADLPPLEPGYGQPLPVKITVQRYWDWGKRSTMCATVIVLIVWKLDRLGRSLAHLIATVATLKKRHVGFRSITEAIDTTTPGGRLVCHLFGALGSSSAI